MSGIQPLEGRGFNLAEPSTNTYTERAKVMFTNQIDKRLRDTLKIYSDFNNLKMGYVVEQALSEYFVSHRTNFPDAKLTIAVTQEPQLKRQVKTAKCMFPNCKAEATGKATRLHDNRVFDVCQDHFSFCEASPDRFKVILQPDALEC